MPTADDILPGLIDFLVKETGKKKSTIKKTTKLSQLLIDGFVLAGIGQDINKLSWMHGVTVTLHELLACATVGELATLLAKKLS